MALYECSMPQTGDDIVTITQNIILDNSYFVLPAVIVSMIIGLIVAGMSIHIRAKFLRLMVAILVTFVSFISLLVIVVFILVVAGVLQGIY